MQLCGLPDIEEFAYKRENDSFQSSKYLCCLHFLGMFDVAGHLYLIKCFILPVHANDDSCVKFTAACMHLLKTYVAFFTHSTEVGEFISYSLYLCRVIFKL